MNPAPAIPALLAGLCDDAALFPPGDAPVAKAVPAHRAHRQAWYAPLVGPFLLGAQRVAEVAEAAASTAVDREPLDVVLVVPGGPAALPSAVAEVAAQPSLRLVGVELGPDPDGTSAEAAARGCAALDRELPGPQVTGAVELRRGPGLDDTLDVVAGTRYRAKYRTGGLVAPAFPDPDELALFITGCTARNLAFKCTAGLHHAVRHTDPGTGFTHHGFLNILAATQAALVGRPHETLAALESEDGSALAAAVAALGSEGTRRLRSAFTAYGTCSIAEPLSDLTGLGLITLPTTLDHA